MTRETLFLIALQTGILFLALWAIFRLTPSIKPSAKAWIWRIAFLKPLLTLMPFAAITLHVLPAEPIVRSFSADPMQGISVPVVENAVLNLPGAPEPTDPLLIAWYIGMACALVTALAGTWKALRIAALAEAVQSPELSSELQRLLCRSSVDRPVSLLHSQRTSTAMLVGGRRYRIVLPTTALADLGDAKLMIAHEVAHIVRKDLIWMGLANLVQAIFFFNPAVWLAVRSSRIEHESATDHHASKLAQVPIQNYARMLIRATTTHCPQLVPGALPMAESYRSIHRRLEAMKHFNEKPTLARRTATLALACATLALLPAYQLAAAKPNEFHQTMSEEPIALVQSTKPAKSNELRLLLPLKVVVGKDGKTRYFVNTKKGYVEIDIDKQGAQQILPRDTSKVTMPIRNGREVLPGRPGLPAIGGAPSRPVMGTQAPALAPIPGAPGQPALADPSVQDRAIARAPGRPPLAIPGRPSLAPAPPVRDSAIARVPGTPGRPSLAPAPPVRDSAIAHVPGTPGRPSLAPTPPVRDSAISRVPGLPALAVPSMPGIPGRPSLGASRQLAPAQGRPAPLTTDPVTTVKVAGTPARVTVSGNPVVRLSTQTISATGQSLTVKSPAKVSTTAQGSPTSLGTAKVSTTGQGASKKLQVIYVGDNQLKIIDTNGQTKVYELKPGSVYELQGGELREIKSSSSKGRTETILNVYRSTDGKNLSFKPAVSKGMIYRFFLDKDGKFKFLPKKDNQ